MDLQEIENEDHLKIACIGPDISLGPKPAIFYFALSEKESLSLSPFNHPVKFILEQNSDCRVFSITIPGHEEGLEKEKAISYWAQKLQLGDDILSDFFQRATNCINNMIKSGQLIPGKIAFMGLSRGAFVASHMAAQMPNVKIVLGFAPLTKLTAAKEFSAMQSEQIQNLNLLNLIPQLYDKTIRFYIGNNDTRVSTSKCFQFIESLAKYAAENRLRTSPIELHITPSIGFMGHGTSDKTFLSGASWILERLND